MKKFLNRGFTLVELIIVMGMTSIFIVVLSDIFVGIAANRLESEATASVAEDGRFILAKLTNDIQRADSVITPEDLDVNVTNITASSATITWQTVISSNSQVQYGPTISYGSNSTLDTNMVTSHSVNLSGLSAGQTYHFRVISNDSANNTTTSADYSFATTGSAGVTHVQSNGTSNDSNSTSIAQAFAGNVAQGNLIVAAVSYESSSPPVSCTDTRGNSYSVATHSYDSRVVQSLAVCYAINATSGANTVTANFAANSAYRRIVVSEYSGVASSNPVDVTASNVGTASAGVTDSVTSTPGVTTQNGDLIYGVGFDNNGPTTMSAGTGFTSRYTLNNTDMLVQDRIQSTAGSASATFTFSSAHFYAAQLVAFKAAVPSGELAPSLGATAELMTLQIGGANSSYFLQGDNLVVNDVSGTNPLNSNRSTVSGLTFQRLGNVGGTETIKIDFTVSSKTETNQGARSQTYSTTVGRR